MAVALINQWLLDIISIALTGRFFLFFATACGARTVSAGLFNQIVDTIFEKRHSSFSVRHSPVHNTRKPRHVKHINGVGHGFKTISSLLDHGAALTRTVGHGT
jgi:hypothetical protein